MDNTKASSSLEEALLHELRFGGIAADNLKELVGIVAHIQRGGLKGIKVFPHGIPPVVEGVRIQGTIAQSDLATFVGEVLSKAPRLAGLELFPYGIPWPEIWRAQIDVGATTAAVGE